MIIGNVLLFHTHTLEFYWKSSRYFLKNISSKFIQNYYNNNVKEDSGGGGGDDKCSSGADERIAAASSRRDSYRNNDNLLTFNTKMSFLILQKQKPLNNNYNYNNETHNNRKGDLKSNFGVR